MKQLSSVTYSTFYTDAYSNHGMLLEWVLKSQTAGVRKRMWQSKHLLKIAKTQTLGRLIGTELFETVTRINRVASLDARLRLRNLQHKILQYLYRPSGALARKLAITIEASVNRPIHTDTHACTTSHVATPEALVTHMGIIGTARRRPQYC